MTSASGPARRPAPGEYAPYYAQYIARVPEGDVLETLAEQRADTRALLATLSEPQGDRRYADGKWSVKDVVGHVCDTERIMVYRALRFARGDATRLPGFDQNSYTPAGRFGDRTVVDLAAELAAIRDASIAFFRSLPDAAWDNAGVASEVPFTVRALAYIVAGHERHHVAILRTRYLAVPQ